MVDTCKERELIPFYYGIEHVGTQLEFVFKAVQELSRYLKNQVQVTQHAFVIIHEFLSIITDTYSPGRY